jgi:hypothetical protein
MSARANIRSDNANIGSNISASTDAAVAIAYTRTHVVSSAAVDSVHDVTDATDASAHEVTDAADVIAYTSNHPGSVADATDANTYKVTDAIDAGTFVVTNSADPASNAIIEAVSDRDSHIANATNTTNATNASDTVFNVFADSPNTLPVIRAYDVPDAADASACDLTRPHQHLRRPRRHQRQRLRQRHRHQHRKRSQHRIDATDTGTQPTCAPRILTSADTNTYATLASLTTVLTHPYFPAAAALIT